MNINDDRSLALCTLKDEKSTSLTCSICNKQFSNEKRYFGHLRIHSGEIVYSCDRCPTSGLSFDSQSRLKIHENSCHSLTRPHKCSKCDNVFDRASQLDYHRRSVHLHEKSQICQICGKGFFRKNDLRTHLNVHLGTNQSICEICGRKFNHVSNLIRHCRTHVGSKPYRCTICGKRFTQISSLARHKRIHERNTNETLNNEKKNDEKRIDEIMKNSEDSRIEKKQRKRQHYCRTCGESFQFMVLLRQHKKLHNRIKETRQANNEIVSDKNSIQSMSFSKQVYREKINILENNMGNSTEQETNNSIRDHLMELARKMNSIENESERDVSISISDILSPYNCNEIELSNVDNLESKLYQNSSMPEKQNDALDKDYDIVQCLNGVDFPNVDSQLPDNSSLESNTKNLIDEPNSESSELKIEKLKESQVRNDTKCSQIEDSQLYMEICESEYLKNSHQQDLELQEIENVAVFQDNCFNVNNEREKVSSTSIEKEVAENSSKSDENLKIDEEITISIKEPALRLVQTETGEQFYELIVNNQNNEDFENHDRTRENERAFNSEMETARIATLSLDDRQTIEFPREENSNKKNCKNFDKSTSETSSSEIIQLLPNIENYRESPTSGQNEMTETPMVRLIQNEDGEQFFELIREPLEYERNRIIENNREKNSDNSSSSTSLDNSKISKKTKRKNALSTNSGSKREKKESTENGRSTTRDQTRKFQCAECDKWFSTSYNFKQHAGTHFSDLQKFQCKDCGLTFAWKSTLNKHLAGNHRPDGPQKFVCEICPKVYSTLSQVNEHVKRDHLKERNHVCSQCGKSFFKKFDLKTHSRTHTNERPYVCRACGKGFHHQSHIIRHERIHSGERPYECNICQRTFTQPGSLKAHRQRHRDVKIDILEYRMDEDDPLTLAVK